MTCRLKTGFLLAALCLSSCASPPPQPIDDARLAAAVRKRPDADSVRQALESASLEELALLPADWQKHLDEHDMPLWWQVRATAWSPRLRAARQAFEAATGRAASSGFPGPIGASERTLDFDDADLSNEVVATFDLLGILGLGPVAAAEELAEAEARAAFGRLEIAAWQANFDVLRALCELAAVRGERRNLEDQYEQAAFGRRRVRALLARARLGRAPVSRVNGFIDLLGTQIAAVRAREQQSLNRLARMSGLLPDAPAFAAVGPDMLDRVVATLARISDSGDLEDLLSSHPELRSRRLDYAVAEAGVRRAAAEAWPRINAGTRFDIRPDDYITGGVLRLSLPWPGSISGLIDAAVARRTAARQRLEDNLVQVRARRSAAVESAQVLEVALRRDAEPGLAATAETWRGLQAMFAVNESAWDLWTDSLNLRRMSIVGYWQTKLAWANARVSAAQDAVKGGDHE